METPFPSGNSNGTWSIDGEGKLVVKEIETGKLKVSEEVKLGSPDKKIGITIYDEDTGAPYCIKVKGGKMVSVAGECGSDSAAPPPPPEPEPPPAESPAPTTNASPTPPPAPISEPGPSPIPPPSTTP